MNGAWLFARKRLGELTPKEKGGPGNNASDNNEALFQKEMNRRWENAALAEFWEHSELNSRLGELTPKEKGGPGNNASDNNDALFQKEMNRRWENAALAEFWEHSELNSRLGELTPKEQPGGGKKELSNNNSFSQKVREHYSLGNKRPSFWTAYRYRDKELQRPMLGEAKRGGKASEQLDSRMSETIHRPDGNELIWNLIRMRRRLSPVMVTAQISDFSPMPLTEAKPGPKQSSPVREVSRPTDRSEN